ncbi:MAG: enoyl-CoA hydratase/isomerase family protein [candidate division NC10 bacterium]|nr:enoyl-CoA hydratase/isomerase family protein [candidate division NC10 bacterium]MBI4839635.1 enoyl-CoA hydratase/isomerase family protein [candidate division NC10 bacterium]
MSGKAARQFVQWTAEGGVATLVVDRPPLNALSYQTKEEIAACLEEVAADSAVRCLIVFGAGARAFSVGSDIKEFPEVTARRLGRQRAAHEHAVYNRLDRFPVPTIAAIEGHCLGGGLELALACDLRVAGETSRLGLPEVTLGVFPAGGGTERLPRLIGEAHARELIYTGEPVDAREAWRIGLVNRVAPAGQALRVAQELGRTIASRPALTLRTVKAVMDRGLAMDLLEAEQIAIEAIGELFQSEAVQEGVAAFLEKRAPNF